MELTLSEAEGRLTELIRRVEAGEDVTLLKDGRPAVRLVAVAPKPSRAEKLRLLDEFQAKVAANALPRWPSAARSQDFLYDDKGLPA